MPTTAETLRAWRGPAVLSHGFRPFFFAAGVWAALAMLAWIAMLMGWTALPTRLDPVSWHAHEFLFGYLGAVLSGFLLTAVPNWTGRLRIAGRPLAGLVALWLLGRVAVGLSMHLPPLAVALADLALPVALGAAMAREIAAGGNWRNLPVLGLLAAFATANGLFHWEAAEGLYAAKGAGMRLGLVTAAMMIALIGGRIVPSFTRNWLVKRRSEALPTPPMQRLDRLALLTLALAGLIWVVRPEGLATGAAMMLAGALHAVRLARWAGRHTGAEPLVWVLHAGYAFVPLGALAIGAAALAPGRVDVAAAQHLWTAGAIGLMTLAVMTRATLGHTGRALSAGPATTALYAALLVAVTARLAAAVWPSQAEALHALSGLAWILAFGGFAVVYGPLLLRPARPG